MFLTKDLIKSFFVASLTTFIMTLIIIVQNGTFFKFEYLKTAAVAGLAAGVAYMFKNMVVNLRYDKNAELSEKENAGVTQTEVYSTEAGIKNLTRYEILKQK